VVGKGYRFVAPIKLISCASAGPSVANALTGGNAGPAVAQDHGNTVPITGPSRSRFRSALAGGFLVVLPAVVGILNYSGWRQKFFSKSASLHIQSIAVLPLENLSGDPAQEYFADGVTEALITDMGQIGALRVISRTSAMQYKGTHKRLREVARELNVDAVLEGAVLRSGNRVRITTQLVEVSTDRHLWAQSYERDLVDVLALQDEVARAVAYQVTIKLSPQKRTRLANERRVNPEAYEAYLKGRYEWNQWTEENLKKSVEYFEQAHRKDPAYAPAWAGLSDSS
jgi:TolB-like protein